MRGARIVELGKPPEPSRIDGAGAFGVVAVALNPLDLAVSSGRYFAGHPPVPYVPGAEAVARLDGARHYLFGAGFGVQRDGFLAERVDFPQERAVPVPDGLTDADAVACGIAGLAGWVPVAHKASVGPGDRVLVLAATGVVGSVALQAARLLGAERVVAAGRDAARLERSRELGADETVRLEGENLAERFREACGGEGPTVVVDPLWGEPGRAAVQAAAPGARVVQVGQSAGPRRAWRPPTSAAGSSSSSAIRTSGFRPRSSGSPTPRSESTSPPAGSSSRRRPSRSSASPTPGPPSSRARKRSCSSDGAPGRDVARLNFFDPDTGLGVDESTTLAAA